MHASAANTQSTIISTEGLKSEHSTVAMLTRVYGICRSCRSLLCFRQSWPGSPRPGAHSHGQRPQSLQLAWRHLTQHRYRMHNTAASVSCKLHAQIKPNVAFWQSMDTFLTVHHSCVQHTAMYPKYNHSQCFISTACQHTHTMCQLML